MPPRAAPRLRRVLLQEKLRENPFLTDEELAQVFDVSVQTIRLDRMALGIPELRQRTREVAQRTLGSVRALSSAEIVGDLVDIRLGQSAVSVLETGTEMAFCRTGIVRGHFIFAQAESLALALVDAPVALTGLANVKFKRSVRVGEKLLAHAQVLRRKGRSLVVQVVTRSRGEQVFRAKFVVFPLPPQEGTPAPVDGYQTTPGDETARGDRTARGDGTTRVDETARGDGSEGGGQTAGGGQTGE
ncbi:MAG: transcription factor FapR [Firmicutes bacterium]|nr:transcription factor FapR [Bacillota bacterium]